MDWEQTLAQHVSDAVAQMFNICTYHDRPILLAALRVSVEGAVATLDAESQAAYEDTLERIELRTIKRPKRKAEDAL